MSHSETFARRTQAYQDAVDSGYDRSSFVVELLEDGYAWKPIIDPDDDVAADEEEVASEPESAAEMPSEPEARSERKLTLQLEGDWSGDAGLMWAGLIAKKLRHDKIAVKVLDSATGATIRVCTSHALKKAAPTEAKKAPKPRVERDWTVKPVISSPTNKNVQALIDRIDAAKGDAAKLRALDTFKRSSTYYKLAGGYLDALLAMAEADIGMAEAA